LANVAIKIDPDWTWGYIKLARSLALEKKCNEAFVQAEVAERRLAGGVGALSRSWLGSTYATCGDVTRARRKLAELHAFESKRYVDPATFADTYASLGEIGEAVGWFQKAYEDRSPGIWFTRRLAADSIRTSPPMPATAPSWTKWHFCLRLSKESNLDPCLSLVYRGLR
jgi:hypothetical protein